MRGKFICQIVVLFFLNMKLFRQVLLIHPHISKALALKNYLHYYSFYEGIHSSGDHLSRRKHEKLSRKENVLERKFRWILSYKHEI